MLFIYYLFPPDDLTGDWFPALRVVHYYDTEGGNQSNLTGDWFPALHVVHYMYYDTEGENQSNLTGDWFPALRVVHYYDTEGGNQSNLTGDSGCYWVHNKIVKYRNHSFLFYVDLKYNVLLFPISEISVYCYRVDLK